MVVLVRSAVVVIVGGAVVVVLNGFVLLVIEELIVVVVGVLWSYTWLSMLQFPLYYLPEVLSLVFSVVICLILSAVSVLVPVGVFAMGSVIMSVLFLVVALH